MKTYILAAAAASLVVPAWAEETKPVTSTQGPPPIVKSKINLGGAGLMTPFYANSQKGATAARGGKDATRAGFSGATGITEGFEHDTRTFIPSLTFNRAIQGQTAELVFGIGTNIGREQPNLTQNDTQINGISIAYENFASTEAAWSVGITVEERETESQNGPLETGAENTELRFAYIRKLSESWGIANQTYYTIGDSYVTTPGGTEKTKDREFYTQFELVGTVGEDKLAFLGSDYKLHPTFGINYQSATEKTAGVSTTYEDGSIWAKAVFQKATRPGAFIPNFTVGVEHVYKSDKGEVLIDEDTYGILGAGGQFIGEGYSFNVALEHRAGFNGKRRTTTLVTGLSIDF